MKGFLSRLEDSHAPRGTLFPAINAKCNQCNFEINGSDALEISNAKSFIFIRLEIACTHRWRKTLEEKLVEKKRREKEIFVNNFVRMRGNLLIDGDFEQTVIPIFFAKRKSIIDKDNLI